MTTETRTVVTAVHPPARLSSGGSASAAHPLQRMLAGKRAGMGSEMSGNNAMMGICCVGTDAHRRAK